MTRKLFTKIFLILLFLLTTIHPQIIYADNSIWIDIDTLHSVARVIRGENTVIARYDNISFGRRGAATLHFHNDDTTPLGSYRIVSIDKKNAFSVFFGLDYPTIQHAQRAIEQHKITKGQYLEILNAHFHDKIPPSTTPLGGAIGIHGVGSGSLTIHHQFNWTRGCVALDNKQIADLSKWAKIGTHVVIH